jgi:hypothetical protein
MEKKTEPDSELILAVKQSDSCDPTQVNNSHGGSNSSTAQEASDGPAAGSSYGRENNDDDGEEWSPETEDLAAIPSASADRPEGSLMIKAELGKEGEEGEEEMNEEEYEEEEDDEQLFSEESELEEAESGGEQTDYENNDIVRYQAAVDVSNLCLISDPFF